MILWFVHVLRISIRIVSAVLFGLRRRGAEHVPAHGPVLLAANHASFLDPPMIGGLSPRVCHFMARSTLGTHGLFGALLRAMGTLFIDRDGPPRAGLDLGVQTLNDGGCLLVFPEGTRTRDGRIGEFKRGVQLMARRVPATAVVPTGIRGSFEAWPRSRRLPRPHWRCEVIFGEPMTAAEVAAPGGLDELRNRVAALADGAIASVGDPPDPRDASRPDGPGGTRQRASDAAILAMAFLFSFSISPPTFVV